MSKGKNKISNTDEKIEEIEAEAEIQSLSSSKYLNNNLSESYSKKIKSQRKNFLIKIEKNKELLNRLKGTPYNFTEKGLICFKENEFKDRYDGNDNQIEVSNACIVPIKQIRLISEEGTKSFIEMIAIIAPTGEELPPVRVAIDKIESGSWMVNSDWGLKVIHKVPPRKDLQIDSIKRISQYMKQEDIFQFTGWAKIDGKRVFLHTGGAIGIDKTIKVDLGEEVLNRIHFTKKIFLIEDTLKITLRFRDVAPIKITLPILALVYMSIFTSIFEELGISLGFLTWVIGPQQSKKTSLVSAICSSFGNFDRSHSPMSFLDGVPSIKVKAAKCKDILGICDDFFPSSNKQESREMNRVAETLIRLCFDRTTGSRSKPNGEIRKTPRARGQIIATGEKLPDVSESRMTRILFIYINKGDINEKELEYIQNHQEELQYSMKKFLEYIIEEFEKIKLEIVEIFKEKVKEASKTVEARTAEMLAGLYVGYSKLIDFASINGVITTEEKEKSLEEGWKTLIDLGLQQSSVVEFTSPIKMLMSAIEVLTNTGKLTTVEYMSAKYMKPQDVMKDGFIGFSNVEKDGTRVNLVYPDLLYTAIKNFYNQQGITFPWSKAEMCKELFNSGYLYKTDKQSRAQIRRYNPRTGREETFIGLLQDKAYITCRYNDKGIILTK